LTDSYFCKASSVNTACGNSISCVRGIMQKHGHNRRAAGSGQAGNQIGGCSCHQSTLPAAGYIKSTGFIGRFSQLIPTVNCAVTSDLVQNGYCNSWKSDPLCYIQSGWRRISLVSGKQAGSGWPGWITVHP